MENLNSTFRSGILPQCSCRIRVAGFNVCNNDSTSHCKIEKQQQMKRACKFLHPRELLKSEFHMIPLKINNFNHMKKLYRLIVLYLTITTFSASSEISGVRVGQLSAANADSLFPSDSLAVVALYGLHSGPGWPDDSSWPEGPLETWYGVTVADNRVTALNLA